MLNNLPALEAVQTATSLWKFFFNHGDAAGCAAQYEKNAILHAHPFGTFKGQNAIEVFWSKLISDGFSQIEFLNPRFELLSDTEVLFTTHWIMNRAAGVVRRDIWALQADGKAKLRENEVDIKRRRYRGQLIDTTPFNEFVECRKVS